MVYVVLSVYNSQSLVVVKQIMIQVLGSQKHPRNLTKYIFKSKTHTLITLKPKIKLDKKKKTNYLILI